MQQNKYLKLIGVPIGLVVAFLLYTWLRKVLNLPDTDQIIANVSGYYAQHGYWTVLVGALAEGLLLVNWYLPGSIVVVLGVALASQNSLNVYLVVSLIILGFFLTSLVNYALGRYGWYRVLLKLGLKEPLDRIKGKVEKAGLPIIFSTYFHPNLGALTATSAGILKLDFKKFFVYSLLATVMWNSIWGIVVYFTGDAILNILGPWLIGSFILVWALYSVYKHYTDKKEPVNIP
jgi:membrane-associated protein